jgi:hypothetical protein
MIAIRQIHTIKSGAITIQIPPDFPSRQVEIILLPVEEKKEKTKDLRKLLLTAPTLTEAESQEYEKVREWMNQWQLTDF